MKKLVCLCSLFGVAPLALGLRCAHEKNPLEGRPYAPLSAGQTLRDFVNHPALSAFARNMLPWDNYTYDLNLKLDAAASLMPYHSNVHPAEVLASVNRLITDVQNGKTVFYNFSADKQNTGLFFFRGRPGAPFAVVCPGGGFAYVGSLHEGFPVAEEISKRGFNAFVLKYRAGSGQWAVEDLAHALAYIFAHAKELNVSVRDYSLWGGSAGARMAAAVGSYGTSVFGAKALPKPSAVIMAYTGQSSFTPHDPPTFIAAAEQDFIAPARIMKRRANALAHAGVAVEFHTYPGVSHGFGSGLGTPAEGWIEQAVLFWKKFISEDKQ